MKKSIFFASAALATDGLPRAGRRRQRLAGRCRASGSVPTTRMPSMTVDLAYLPKDADGFYTIFNGKDFNGWRTYGRDAVT